VCKAEINSASLNLCFGNFIGLFLETTICTRPNNAIFFRLILILRQSYLFDLLH
jgi:hypothetical protein